MFRHVPECFVFPVLSTRRYKLSVLCKLTFSKRVGCRVTSNRWDFVWEIKYILRSANAKYRYSYLFFCKENKGDLPLMYSCIHRFSRFFLAVIVWPLSLSSSDSIRDYPGCQRLFMRRVGLRPHEAPRRPGAKTSGTLGNQRDPIKILVQCTIAYVTLRKLQFSKLTPKNSLNLHTQSLGDQWLQFSLAPSFLYDE